MTEKVWPSPLLAGVTLYPRITVLFDAPVDQTSATDGIRLLNSQSVAIAKVREIFTTTEGKGAYSFELSEALQRNSTYRIVLDAGVKDLAGVTLGTTSEISFTTRTKAYQTGNVVESFDNTSAFWDPEASGSTIGTDNPLTTFTASHDIFRAGAPSENSTMSLQAMMAGFAGSSTPRSRALAATRTSNSRCGYTGISVTIISSTGSTPRVPSIR